MARTASVIPRFAALFGLLVLFCGFVVIVAGLATIQKATNGLGSNLPDATVALYNLTYSAAVLPAYPAQHGFQYSYIWFIIFFNLFNFLLVAAIVAVPRVAFIGRNAALALVAVAATLTITVVNNLAYLHKNPFALQTFTRLHINVTYAGAILVAVGDLLIILALGMWEHEHPNVVNNPNYAHKTTNAPVHTATTTAV